ncbi:hypothetical protein L8P27_00385 [Enterobacter asburiae]|uniref:hypothetical protein n=1 Tax=Enterobacter asburiae TaxID=61645 RepID=UPI0020069A36|nr:hypothetical protein [Enterobacter asburiae]MCK7226321.1 hypothetical protein [Enterobacter asburiae]
MKKVVLFFAIVSFSAVAGITDITTKPVALTALKKNSAQYIDVCKAVDDFCKDGTSIWKEKSSNDIFYLITSHLQLMKMKKEGDVYSKIASWDFTKEANNEDIPDDELTKSDVYIYPALYPLSKVKTAVALVSKWSTTYSGGGREEEYANFIMINDDGTYQLAFKNIPFSSREMIKACFTEDDYAKQSHCHDESWSILSLKITDDSKDYYSWKFITKSYNWSAFKEKSSTQVSINESVAYPFQPQPQHNK